MYPLPEYCGELDSGVEDGSRVKVVQIELGECFNRRRARKGSASQGPGARRSRPLALNRVGYFSPRCLTSLSRWRSLRLARRSFTS